MPTQTSALAEFAPSRKLAADADAARARRRSLVAHRLAPEQPLEGVAEAAGREIQAERLLKNHNFSGVHRERNSFQFA